MSELKFYNTLSRKAEVFTPMEDGKVRMYTCGPTVYNYAHIGNYRAYMFEDLLRRHLKWSGYDVVQVMNLTDIDDKTIKGSQEESVTLEAYTKKYIEAFFEDLKELSIEEAEHYPSATEHIKEMIDLIQRLMDNGYAYQSDDGSIYFDVAKFSDYGKLARIDKTGMKAGARVDQDEYDKQNLADFALWKAWSKEDGDVVWDAPWGKGRPGWHIECSAMGMKYLGESFDIHTGGIDNMFPHHENEIAQSEAATGKTFVKYWLHCAHLMVNGQKMAKSSGNFFTLRDLVEKGYAGREIRYVLLSGHYRQMLNFTFDTLSAARTSLARLDEFRIRLTDCAGEVQASDSNLSSPPCHGVAESEDGSGGEDKGEGAICLATNIPEWAESARSDFRSALDDDLNMSEAMGSLFDMVHAGNKVMDSGNVSDVEAAAVLSVLKDLDTVLGYLFVEDGEKPDDAAMKLLDQRTEARNNKNWVESDALRDKLAEMGWDVKDTPDGQKLKKR